MYLSKLHHFCIIIQFLKYISSKTGKLTTSSAVKSIKPGRIIKSLQVEQKFEIIITNELVAN